MVNWEHYSRGTVESPDDAVVCEFASTLFVAVEMQDAASYGTRFGP
jgi:hypothetical protein